MIEPVIYASVGFLIAALLALMAAPAVTRRAFRLAAARARLLSPLSEIQARAERDALRGKHAVEITRIEQRLRAIEDSRALALAEIGRRANRIVQLEEVSSERAAEIARQREEIAGLRGEGISRDAELAAREIALRDLTRQRDVAEDRLAATLGRVAHLEEVIDDDRSEIATLMTQVAGLEMELADVRRSADSAAAAAGVERERLAAALNERINAAVTLSGELGSARARVSALLVELDGRESEAASLRRRLAEIEPRLARAEATGESLAIENARQLQRIADREAAHERAQAGHREIGERLTERLASARAREDALTNDLRAAANLLATAEGALTASRAERGELQSQIEQLRARLADASATAQVVAKGDQALRQAIIRLGREITRGMGEMAEPESAAAHVVSFNRREPAASAHAAESDGEHEQALVSER